MRLKVGGTFHTPLISPICQWILKPFELQVAHIGGFDLVYLVVITTKLVVLHTGFLSDFILSIKESPGIPASKHI